MNYKKYHFNLKDCGFIVLKGFIVTAMAAYLFYNSAVFMIFLPAVIIFVAKQRKKEAIKKRMQQLENEFMNMLKNLSSNLLAGYSLENAWKETEKEMQLLYGSKSLMVCELREMNRQVAMNETLEKVLMEFASRTGVEDIENFADIFSFAKRSGGKFVEIIESTTYRMWSKYETNRQIAVAVSAKSLEQKTMNVVPILLLAFLKTASADYMSVLYGNFIGIMFMSICLVAYVMSVILAQKLLDISI